MLNEKKLGFGVESSQREQGDHEDEEWDRHSSCKPQNDPEKTSSQG